MSNDDSSQSDGGDSRKISPGPINLTWREKRMLIACVTMMDENISEECEGEEAIEVLESLKSKVGA